MILVAGSANLDFVVRAARIPLPGETVLGKTFQTFPGGKGANQAIACARAGADTSMLVALGDDDFAKPLEASLAQAGVHLHIRRPPDLPTGTAFICLSDEGENAITVAPGANASLAPADLPALDGVSHLVMQLETPLEAVTAYATAAKAAGVQVVLNAAPAQVLPDALLEAVSVLVVNETELAIVAGGAAGPLELPAGREEDALARITVPNVVVTLGAHGCLVRWDGRTFRQAAFAIQPVDTTAAGDSFVGALVAALARGDGIRSAVQMASAAGALACLTLGAQTSIPTLAQAQAFVAAQSSKA